MSWLKPLDGGTLIHTYIAPGAAKNEICGLHGQRLKIKIKAPPIDGRANEELISFVSEILGVSKSLSSILRGESSRNKDLFISLHPEKARSILLGQFQ